MDFDLDKFIEMLSRTPKVLSVSLDGLSPEWIQSNEGGDSWSPYDVVGHLIHGELTDWIPRAQIILQKGENPVFEPFDRFAQKQNSIGKSLKNLLHEFAKVRNQNILTLQGMKITTDQLGLKGVHPEFGEVTLQQLLSTWVVHDLGHLAQISRTMAKQLTHETGPWTAYLPILDN